MKNVFATRLLLLIGMVSFLFGSGVALSSTPLGDDSVAFMEGPFAHAMQQSKNHDAMNDCNDEGAAQKKCCDCDLSKCSMTGTPTVFVPGAGLGFGEQVASAYDLGSEDTFIGLNRHNLPLPPP